MRKTIGRLVAVLLAVSLLFAGCGDETKTGSLNQTNEYKYYYINGEEDQLLSVKYEPVSAETGQMVTEFTGLVSQQPDEEDAEPLLPENVRLENQKLDNQVLSLYLSSEYNDQSAGREILTRAGLVRTFTQIPGVSRVRIFAGDQPLKDADGNEIGALGEDSFVENVGKTIHSYQDASMKLYYTDQTGSVLVPEERTVYYSSNEPLERAVVQELIDGPTEGNGLYPTLPSDTKVLSAAVQEGICYVSFDKNFSNSIQSVEGKIQLYSIVNSLAETCHVQQVQFSINGNTDITLKGDMSLDHLYEEDLSLVRQD